MLSAFWEDAVANASALRSSVTDQVSYHCSYALRRSPAECDPSALAIKMNKCLQLAVEAVPLTTTLWYWYSLMGPDNSVKRHET